MSEFPGQSLVLSCAKSMSTVVSLSGSLIKTMVEPSIEFMKVDGRGNGPPDEVSSKAALGF